ncbi:MAG: GNAT family N-acetyltransferase [Actinobacteria bacterium]|nr:GNAT family N-acetyltransferase [Actinomycetota bacterium]
MTDDKGMLLRPVRAGDLAAVRRLNTAAVPAVNGLSAGELVWFSEVATSFLVAVQPDSSLVGFLVGLEGPGLDYDSSNYRWFEQRYENFLYVDRVVVDPSGQGRGIGRSLYGAFVERAEGHRFLCAEVNIRPRNDVSLAFHDAFGFCGVGEQDTEGGSKRVLMLVKEI